MYTLTVPQSTVPQSTTPQAAIRQPTTPRPTTTGVSSCPRPRTGGLTADEQLPLRISNDSDLLQRLSAGDEQTWSETIARYAARLRRIGGEFRLSAAEVDDALQATWLSLFRRAEQVRDVERLGAWLASTMRRACLRVLCGPARRHDELVDDWTRYETLPAGDAEHDSVQHRVELADQVASMWGLVDQLSPRHRQLLHALYSSDEPSYAAISARTGIPVGAIGPTRQRALAQLRRLLTTPDAAASRPELSRLAA
jgi:RNA polymerase sigma factor (sigma-70 family)